MSNLLDWLNAHIFNPTFVSVISALSPLIVSLLILIFRLIASRIKNESLKKLILILPEAMEFAEQTGSSPSNKLDIAANYIKQRVKKISRTEIVEFIESGITISKTINTKYTQEKSVSSESRISIPERRSKK